MHTPALKLSQDSIRIRSERLRASRANSRLSAGDARFIRAYAQPPVTTAALRVAALFSAQR
jgi:hypothetical protein